jgi:mannose-6-phosphate isomerase-like protein (cupin superfamily)
MKPERNYTASKDARRVGVSEALSLVAAKTEGLPSAAVLEHCTLQVKMYSPRDADRQTEHTRDEVYVVARGSGWFVNGSDRHPFQTGDMLFVPAGVSHRFEQFTDDFCTWVVFYGPEGGEAVAAARPRARQARHATKAAAPRTRSKAKGRR